MRVGAIQSIKDGVAKFYGYGEYVGDEIPSKDSVNKFTKMLGTNGIANPKIVLDDGRVVWGCECWWGPEDQIKKRLEGLTILNVE